MAQYEFLEERCKKAERAAGDNYEDKIKELSVNCEELEYKWKQGEELILKLEEQLQLKTAGKEPIAEFAVDLEAPFLQARMEVYQTHGEEQDDLEELLRKAGDEIPLPVEGGGGGQAVQELFIYVTEFNNNGVENDVCYCQGNDVIPGTFSCQAGGMQFSFEMWKSRF